MPTARTAHIGPIARRIESGVRRTGRLSTDFPSHGPAATNGAANRRHEKRIEPPPGRLYVCSKGPVKDVDDAGDEPVSVSDPEQASEDLMTDGFEERKRAYEEKFAHDEDLRFRAEARRNRLLGLWVAELLGLSGEEAENYARELVMADLEEPGEEDVFRKVRADLDAKGVDISDHRIRHRMQELLLDAMDQIRAEK